MIDWLGSHLLLTVSLLLGIAGLCSLLSMRNGAVRGIGWLLTLACGVVLAVAMFPFSGTLAENVLFAVFSIGALGCGVCMVTSRNPVYGALWFALVTLSVCGMFLLQSAPFLAAATLIVYAGAIIVTFLFVIMLSQQNGLSRYDQDARQPFLATCAAFILLGALLGTIQQAIEQPQPTNGPVITNVLSRPQAAQPLGTMHGLGRSLFGDYLFAVELAGTLLLVASIGAIVIAPRKEQGKL